MRTSSSLSSRNFFLPSIFPSITRFRRQFLRKMWPIQSAFLLSIACGIFLSFLILCNTSWFWHHHQSKWSSPLFLPQIFKTLQIFLIYFTQSLNSSRFWHHHQSKYLLHYSHHRFSKLYRHFWSTLCSLPVRADFDTIGPNVKLNEKSARQAQPPLLFFRFCFSVSVHQKLIYIKNQRDATWQYVY